MSWATEHIRRLQEGETVQFRPRGNSMRGRIESGQLVTVEPCNGSCVVGEIVLCKVRGNQYLHIVNAVRNNKGKVEVQIANNRGFVNGWTSRDNVYGRVTKVEP